MEKPFSVGGEKKCPGVGTCYIKFSYSRKATWPLANVTKLFDV